jgi:AraC-like DNA-binding protein
MTPRASSLTRRANRARPASAAPRGQTIGSIRPFLEAFVRLGAPREALLAAAGLGPAELGDPDAVVTGAACSALFGEAGRRLPLANLALRVAELIQIGDYPLLDYLILTSPTVGDGFGHLVRYLRILGSPTELAIADDRRGTVRVVATQGNPFSNEFCLSLAVLDFGRETEGRFRAAGLSFRHRLADRADYERRLSCRVRDAAEEDSLTVDRRAWGIPLRRRDSVLHGVLRAQADEALGRSGSDGTFRSEVLRALAPRVAGGDVGLAAVASALATSARTLQRRLAEEGVTYQDVLDGARREGAERYLADSRLSVGEVGYLLGFSEPAAFHRAFRRWTGRTPLEFRRSRRPPP